MWVYGTYTTVANPKWEAVLSAREHPNPAPTIPPVKPPTVTHGPGLPGEVLNPGGVLWQPWPNTPAQPVLPLPPAAVLPQAPIWPAPVAPAAPATRYSPVLGVRYVPVARGDGTYGVQLTTAPAAGSPLAAAGFEPGDMILALDGLPIRSADDVESHTDDTTVDYVDVRTGGAERTSIVIRR